MPLELKAKVARTAAGLDHGNHLRLTAYGVKDLHIQNDDASSVSQCHLPDGFTAAAGGNDSFVFVPEHETVKICYELDNMAGLITRAKLELFTRFREAPLWSLDLAKCGPDWLAHGKHVVAWDGRLPAAPADAAPGTATANGFEHTLVDWAPQPIDKIFPDGFVTLEHSPYKLKLTVARDGQRGEPAMAWTHLHLVVVELLIELGPEKIIPQSGTSAEILEREKQIRATLDKAGGLPAAATQKILLVSNIFKILDPNNPSHDEMSDNTGYIEYKRMWDQGPHVPIIAKVHLKDSKGATVKIEDGPGAKALGLTSVLWDWQDIAENVAGQQSQPAPRAFIQQAIAYYKDNTHAHNTKNGTVVTPNQGDNCHVDRGGKRGLNATAVFPAQPGYAHTDTLTDGAFPFAVRACPGRPWAAYSHGWTQGELQGRTGILFQASRMAGDSFKLRACVAVEKEFAEDPKTKKKAEQVTVDVPDDLPLKASAILVKEVGTFEIWRELHITRYVRKTASIRDFIADHLTDVQKPYAEAYIQLNDLRRPTDSYLWSEHRLPDDTAPDYNQACRDALAAVHDRVLSLAVDPAANHEASGSEFELRSFAQFNAALLAKKKGNAAEATKFKKKYHVKTETQYLNYVMNVLPAGEPVLDHLQIVGGHRDGDSDPARDGITILHFDQLHSQMNAAIAAGLPHLLTLQGEAVDTQDATRNRCAFAFWDATVDTFVHEIGHHLFLPHSLFPTTGDNVPGGAQPERHDALDPHCMMSYNDPCFSFCGLCQLRLRGWDPGPNSPHSKLNKIGANNKKP